MTAASPELERLVRIIVVQEMTILARALGGQSAANSYAIDSFRASQDREAVAEPERHRDPRPWWRRHDAPAIGRGGPLSLRHGARD